MYEDLANIDKRIHEPARLAILTVLSACTSADFLFLQRVLGLTKGNLSSHLAKLEEAGLIQIEKRIVAKQSCTTITITVYGRKAIEQHWQRLDRLRANATLDSDQLSS